MKKEDVRFCIDCNYVEYTTTSFFERCKHPLVLRARTSCVTKEPVTCIIERKDEDGVCGRDGELWEEKENQHKELPYLLITTICLVTIGIILIVVFG
jgi:hypothetical protein